MRLARRILRVPELDVIRFFETKLQRYQKLPGGGIRLDMVTVLNRNNDRYQCRIALSTCTVGIGLTDTRSPVSESSGASAQARTSTS